MRFSVRRLPVVHTHTLPLQLYINTGNSDTTETTATSRQTSSSLLQWDLFLSVVVAVVIIPAVVYKLTTQPKAVEIFVTSTARYTTQISDRRCLCVRSNTWANTVSQWTQLQTRAGLVGWQDWVGNCFENVLSPLNSSGVVLRYSHSPLPCSRSFSSHLRTTEATL